MLKQLGCFYAVIIFIKIIILSQRCDNLMENIFFITKNQTHLTAYNLVYLYYGSPHGHKPIRVKKLPQAAQICSIGE